MRIITPNHTSPRCATPRHALSSQSLEGNATLTVLDIAANEIGDAGCGALALSLKTNTTLKALDVANNGVGDHGCKAVADSLKTNRTLTSVDFAVNGVHARARLFLLPRGRVESVAVRPATSSSAASSYHAHPALRAVGG